MEEERTISDEMIQKARETVRKEFEEEIEKMKTQINNIQNTCNEIRKENSKLKEENNALQGKINEANGRRIIEVGGKDEIIRTLRANYEMQEKNIRDKKTNHCISKKLN